MRFPEGKLRAPQSKSFITKFVPQFLLLGRTHDEYPSPARPPRDSIHLHQPKGQDTAKSGSRGPNEIECSHPLLDLISSIPGTKKINTARVKSCLKNAEENSKATQHLPIGDETKALVLKV